MPGIVALVSAISSHVNSSLQAAGYPALSAGKILIGRQHLAENDAPPQIVFIPRDSTFGPKSMANPSNVSLNQPYSPEMLQTLRQRSIATEFITFEVHCWGAKDLLAPDTDADFDIVQALYQQVKITCHLLATGVSEVGALKWTDDTQHARAGREVVFSVTFATPILDTLLSPAQSMPLAPANTVTNPTTTLTPLGGSPETGCSG